LAPVPKITKHTLIANILILHPVQQQTNNTILTHHQRPDRQRRRRTSPHHLDVHVPNNNGIDHCTRRTPYEHVLISIGHVVPNITSNLMHIITIVNDDDISLRPWNDLHRLDKSQRSQRWVNCQQSKPIQQPSPSWDAHGFWFLAMIG
jgi:hypothetical protein